MFESQITTLHTDTVAETRSEPVLKTMAVSYVSPEEFVGAIKQGNVNGLLDMFTNGHVDKTQSYVSLFFCFYFINACFSDPQMFVLCVHSSK